MSKIQIKNISGGEILAKLHADIYMSKGTNEKKDFTTTLEKYLNSLNENFKLVTKLRCEYDFNNMPFPHATTSYALINNKDYFQAVSDLYQTIKLGANILNFHIPFEIQFQNYRDFNKGYDYMNYVTELCDLFGVTAVWENAPILKYGDWTLELNTDFIPKDYKLCLDIGHLMLGCRNREQALKKIDDFLLDYGANVLHLHLHINNFVKDEHIYNPELVKEFLGTERFLNLIANRSYIFEKGA